MIEQHVTSLEISQKLKSLGVKQKSIFWWWDIDPMFGVPHIEKRYPESESDWIGVSAFLASEMAGILKARGNFYEQIFFVNKYRVYDREEGNFEEADILPDALGKMLIYLIENHLIETSGVLAGEGKGEQTTHQA